MSVKRISHEKLRAQRRVRPSMERLEDRTAPAVLDLTTRGAMGELAGAIFRQSDMQPTGTGFIDSFVRIDAQGNKQLVEQGYNSDYRPIQFDEDTNAQVNHAVLLSDIPVVNLGGRLYREFLLDINQTGSQSLLSLDEVRIYVATSPTLHGYDVLTHQLGGANPLFDMDTGGDNSVTLEYRLNSGSGSGDMLMYVPDAALGAPPAGSYLFLYSKFGANHPSNAGFEEWAFKGGGDSFTPSNGAISGVKFHDLDQDGLRDADEPLLANWTIFIDANQNNLLDADEVYVITNTRGEYTFTNLSTGLGDLSTYRIREVQQDEWVQTTANPPDILLSFANQHVIGIDFGNFFTQGGSS